MRIPQLGGKRETEKSPAGPRTNLSRMELAPTAEISLWKFVVLASTFTITASTTTANPNSLRTWPFDHLQGACANAVPLTRNVRACSGDWTGHVQFADNLCGSQFKVCSWLNQRELGEIPWTQATGVPGCYAYNAAQDGDTCSACKEDLGSDDMAGVGRDCPHVNFGQRGCLSSGKIEASCCVDTLQLNACRHRRGITGVLCCRKDWFFDTNGVEEKRTPETQQRVHTAGEKIELKCPLVVWQKGQIQWERSGSPLAGSSSAIYNIPFATPDQSGFYGCRDVSSAGVNKVSFNVTIKAVVSNACRDGTSEGFHESQNVRGCAGSWEGHIKKASRQICGRKWRVCKPTDKVFLDQIEPEYLREYGGCFAYNAMDTGDRCAQCKNSHRKSMAGFGRDCPVNVKTSESSRNNVCYARKIQIYTDKFMAERGKGCIFRERHGISGVLCCRKPQRHLIRHHIDLQQGNSGSGEFLQSDAGSRTRDVCPRPCLHGGTCLRDGRCLCLPGFHGIACQHGRCKPRCVNGGKCIYGWCRCEMPFYGSACQHTLRGWQAQFLKTDENTALKYSNQWKPIEDLPQNDGTADWNEIPNAIFRSTENKEKRWSVYA